VNRRVSPFHSILPLVAAAVIPSIAGAQGRTPDFARALTANLGLQGRVMWIDGSANIDRITNIEGVRDIVAHCRKANLTTLVVDVKPVVGQVLFNSKIGDRLRVWKGKTYPDFDVLAAFVDEGHKAGMDVAASFNVFSEGHKYFSTGLAYRKPEWQSVTYYVDRTLTALDGARLPIRAAEDPDDPTRTLVESEDAVQEPTQTPGASVAVALDSDRKVAGVIDPALLDTEPLTAPEDGQLLRLDDGAMDWATQHLHAGERVAFNAVGRRTRVTEAPSEKVAAFVNPLNPEARAYEIALMKEVAQNYAVDAIVFDRMRYANLYNDYSDLTRAAFERWTGHAVNRWPEDVLEFNPLPGNPPKHGKLFKPWLEFRAKVIRDFVAEATDAIRAVKPSVQFGSYVGSWFADYYGVGVNWGSEKFPVRTSWATPTYNEAGYAEFLDWLSTGCYYPIPFRNEARAMKREEGGTVEAAAQMSVAATANSIPVYAGIYALNYLNKPEDFQRAIQAAVRASSGVMIFDLSYIYDYNWWPYIEQAFPQPALAPNRDTTIVASLRAAQDAVRTPRDARSSGPGLPAIPYQPGGG
jgi:uncharacterized lipoprotein YddW (UPF0748 family)